MFDLYEELPNRPDLQIEYVKSWITTMLTDKYLKDGEQMRGLLEELVKVMKWRDE